MAQAPADGAAGRSSRLLPMPGVYDAKEIEMANLVGKRHYCIRCAAAFIVTRGGEGTLKCCGEPMALKQ